MIASWIPKVSSCLALALLPTLPVLATPQLLIRDAILEKANASDSIRNQVQLRVSVEENGDPVPGLTADELELYIDGEPQTIKSLKPVTDNPQPTKVVILMDVSNSMEKPDSGGRFPSADFSNEEVSSDYCLESQNCRKAGAIRAIKNLEETFANQPIELNLVTFGVKGKGCYFNGDRSRPRGYIPPDIVDQLSSSNFVSINNFEKIRNNLETIGTQKFCASTDLYSPLIETLTSLERQYQRAIEAEEEFPPRFAVIMLSDGFHSHRRTCSNNTEVGLFQQFEETVTQVNRRFPVYTIGYGLSDRQLAKKIGDTFGTYDLSTPIDLQKEFVCPFENRTQYPKVAPWVVDHQKLAEISDRTNGKYETSGNAEGISRVLNQFVNSILGQYEIEYQQVNAIQGQSNMAMIKWPEHNAKSNQHEVRLDYFSGLPQNLLLIFTGVGIAGTVGWTAAFRKWSKDLK